MNFYAFLSVLLQMTIFPLSLLLVHWCCCRSTCIVCRYALNELRMQCILFVWCVQVLTAALFWYFLTLMFDFLLVLVLVNNRIIKITALFDPYSIETHRDQNKNIKTWKINNNNNIPFHQSTCHFVTFLLLFQPAQNLQPFHFYHFFWPFLYSIDLVHRVQISSDIVLFLISMTNLSHRISSCISFFNEISKWNRLFLHLPLVILCVEWFLSNGCLQVENKGK